MNKQEIIKQLDDASFGITRLPVSYINQVLKETAQWLEQTETVDEVREALERLSERTGADHAVHFYSNRSYDVITTAEGFMVKTGFAVEEPLVEAIDSIHPEPSSEPPDPSEITPGKRVPTTDGLRVAIYPRGENSYIAMMPSGDYWQPVIIGEEHLDWKQWRKDQ